MQRLPTLTDGQSRYQLPLADTSAARLTEALLLDDQQARVESLACLLSHDPTLALWTLCRAQSAAQQLDELAHWLECHALDVLDWEEADLVWDQQSFDSQRAAWQQRVAQSVTAARQSSCYLAGLLCESKRWLDDARVGKIQGETSHTNPLLPDWLTQELDAISVSRPADNGHVGAADVARQSPTEIAEQWSATIPGVEKLLIPLIQKLRRLRSLERDYEATLQREKIDALKELAYGASHEINNPLANISTRAQTLLRDETDPERRQKLETINRQAFRAHEMITHMMQFARPPRLAVTNTNLVSLIDDVIAKTFPDAQPQETELINRSAGETVMAHVDSDQLISALKAMIVNSLQALRKGGRIEMFARHESAGHVAITVHDTGPGIPDDIQRHVFDPFFSGREAGRGLGFGLCKCWGVVQLHGGTIDVESAKGRGTTFTIRLPLEATSAHKAAAS